MISMNGRRPRLVLLAMAALLVALGAGWRALRTRGLSAYDLATELRRGDDPRFTWRSVDDKHWQIVASAPGEVAETTDAREGTSSGCPAGMVRVRGAFRREGNGSSTGEVERIQDAACTEWISRDFPARCQVFDAAKIAKDIERVPTHPMDFCVDRFEYPNVFGEYPIIVTTFHEAAAICKKSDKRLCSENEWTFACEGEEARPYPYGWTRDDTACVVDRPWRLFTEGALQPRNGRQAREELDRLWQGEASGARPTCRSPFGVYDMAGNVDEWTTSVNTSGYRSVLKGGYWGPVRARCRPSTRAHNEDFIAYQQGFRCCAEPSAETVDASADLVAASPEGGADASEAGAPTSSNATDASPPVRADLVAVWREPDDEMDALTTARTSCSAATRHGNADGAWAGLAGPTVALLALRWRRPGRRRSRRETRDHGSRR